MNNSVASRALIMFCTCLISPYAVCASEGDVVRVPGNLQVDGIYFSGDANKTLITKPSDISTPWKIATPDIYFLDGKVGIGTMTPTTDLDINGTVKANVFIGDGSGLSNVTASTVSNGIYSTGNYSDPSWLASLSGSKINGTISSGTIPDSGITSTKIANAAVTDAHIGGIISAAKLDLSSVQKKYSKVAVVAQSGADYSDPVTAMSDYIAWCGTSSASNPCLLKIMPGVYDVGFNYIRMQPYIDIEGSGENTTVITGTNGSGFDLSFGLVNGASNAELRYITIKNTGAASYTTALGCSSASPKVTNVTLITSGGDFSIGMLNVNSSPVLSNVTVNVVGRTTATGISNSSSSPTISNTTAKASGATNRNVGIFNTNPTSLTVMNNVVSSAAGGIDNMGVYNVGCSPTMTNVSSSASGGTNSYGVYNDSASTSMNGVTAGASGGTKNYGLYNYLTGSITYTTSIDRSTFEGATNSIYTNSDKYTVRVGASKLTGGTVDSVGNYICVAVYNGSTYTSLGVACK